MAGVEAPRHRWSDWLPEPGQSVEALALGRSGSSLCARVQRCAARVLVEAGLTSIRPVEGELFTLAVRRRTRDNGFWLLEGQVHSPRLEASVLRLKPLALYPRDAGASENGAACHDGRAQYELERVVPRVPGFAAAGPAVLEEIAAFWDAGDVELAELLAGELLARDLRCLEAHALLGGFFLNAPLEQRWTERALRHFRVGVTIGELSLGAEFDGYLPWRWRGNRGLLRCLYGYARCLERVGDAGEAWGVFRRLLNLAPEDPMDVRKVLAAAR
jgi:hypothetical protein